MVSARFSTRLSVVENNKNDVVDVVNMSLDMVYEKICAIQEDQETMRYKFSADMFPDARDAYNEYTALASKGKRQCLSLELSFVSPITAFASTNISNSTMLYNL
jgi:hypothetical protein